MLDDVLDDIIEDERAAITRRLREQTRTHTQPSDEGNDLSVINFSV